MKREISFKDKQGNLAKIEIEIKEGRLSMSGEYANSCGQCNDSIKPKNEPQKELLAIWNKWHLNDMNAGTERQENALAEWRKENNIKGWAYDKEIEYLKSIRLYTDKGYKYGSAWLKRDLPKDIETALHEICNMILTIEEDERTGKKISELAEGELLNLMQGQKYDTYNEVIALALHLDLTEGELKGIEKDDNYLTYAGIDYFVGTYDEGEEEARRYLTDDPELWKQAVEAGMTIAGLEEWAEEVITIDGIGHILNGWNGESDDVMVNGVGYFVCRR